MLNVSLANKESVAKVISDMGWIISKKSRLPKGSYQIITDKTNLTSIEVKNALIKLRSEKGIVMDTRTSNSRIKDHIIKQKFDLTKRLPKGTVPRIANELNVGIHQVRHAVISLKSSVNFKDTIKGAIHMLDKEKFDIKDNDLAQLCLKNNLVRSNPNSEARACNMITKCIIGLPWGGKGIIIGTPTAFCASSSSCNKMFLTDNLKVAHILDVTTDANPSMIIGSGVDKAKATLKAHHWKTNNTTNHWEIITDIVDRDSFTYYITKYAEKHTLLKVILMNSGVWECNNSTYIRWKMDLNFKAPSEYLVKKYPGLHIVAMTIGKEGNYQYNIQHLNKDKVVVYK